MTQHTAPSSSFLLTKNHHHSYTYTYLLNFSLRHKCQLPSASRSATKSLVMVATSSLMLIRMIKDFMKRNFHFPPTKCYGWAVSTSVLYSGGLRFESWSGDQLPYLGYPATTSRTVLKPTWPPKSYGTKVDQWPLSNAHLDILLTRWSTHKSIRGQYHWLAFRRFRVQILAEQLGILSFVIVLSSSPRRMSW